MNDEPEDTKPDDDAYAKWEAEETARLNALADMARKMGIIIPVTTEPAPPPS